MDKHVLKHLEQRSWINAIELQTRKILQPPCRRFFAKAELLYIDAPVIAPVGLGRLAAHWQVNSISWKNKNFGKRRCLSFPMFLCFAFTETRPHMSNCGVFVC